MLTRWSGARMLLVLVALLGMFLGTSIGHTANLPTAGAARAPGPVAGLQAASDGGPLAWFRRQDPPSPHGDLAVVASERYLYQIGGMKRNFVSDIDGYVARYDPQTNTWDATVADLPVPVGEINGVRVGDAIYILGGITQQGSLYDRVQRYHEATNEWTTSTSTAPRLRSRYGAVAVDGLIYRIGGGHLPNSFWSVEVDRYDPLRDQWNSPASPANLPWPISFPCAEAINGRIYVAGESRAAVYDPVTNRWDDAAMSDPPPGVQIGPGADFVLGGNLVCAGGANDPGGTPSPTVWMYDPASGRWQQAPPMHEARYRLEGDSLGGVGYALGGWKTPGVALGWEASTALEALSPSPVISRIYLSLVRQH